MTSPSGNFGFLAQHAPLLADLGATAERLFPFDPASCVLKLRLLAEATTQDIAARLGVRLVQPTQAELLRAVDARLGMDAQVRQLFHVLRRSGNQAAHEADHRIGYREGLDALKVAREVAVWFHRSFGPDRAFRPGPFVLPDDPSQRLVALRQQLADLQTQLQDVQASRTDQTEVARLLEAQAAQERTLAARAQEEAAIYQALAEEAEQRAVQLQAQFDAQLQDDRRQAGADEQQRFAERAAQAARNVHLDEAATRRLIDAQLTEAGWQADTQQLSYAAGTRPQRGRNLAIAEWPAPGQQAADYVLFAGLVPLATVEAKRQNINVAGKIGQAERYARGLQLDAGATTAWAQLGMAEPWADGEGAHFQVPFVYSCNGRPFVKQLAELSGTWFRDARDPAHIARALPSFHSPQGLLDQLTRSRADAQNKLQQEGFGYLRLRPYQTQAIAAVEAALADGRLEARLAKAQAAADRLTPALLAKAFRGELVPQHPADEPAAVLLQRLAAIRPVPAAKARRPRAGQGG